MKVLRLLLAGVCAWAGSALLSVPALARTKPVITVFAASSLAGVLNTIGKSYQRETGKRVIFAFAASSTLAHQIEASAGADIFISADTAWMDYLDRKALIERGTRRNLLGNRLVLITPADSQIRLRIAPHFNLADALGGGRLAIADPDAVPAGKYARQALASLGAWKSVANHLAPAEDVQVALAYVARGEAPLGIVYATDALSEPRVRIVGAFPDRTHTPIVYPVALTRDAGPDAASFLEFLGSADARAVFRKAGFTVMD